MDSGEKSINLRIEQISLDVFLIDASRIRLVRHLQGNAIKFL